MAKKILYLECNSGISGDMTVASLLDLGADRDVLMNALSSLPLSGYSIEIKDVFKSGIRACDFDVILAHDNHDHDMAYLHGQGEDTEAHAHETGAEHAHTHVHEDGTEHTHSHTEEVHMHSDGTTHTHADGTTHTHTHADGSTHTHESGHHHHHHDARNLNDIIAIIQAGNLTEGARTLAIRIFRILAEAEAQVHGKSIEEIHFHEVGAVDSIVDIVAAAVCIDNLAADEIVVSALTEGSGQIRCQHGIIPVPVPATAAIAANNGLILKLTNVQGELVTPTGAAIAAALRSDAVLPEEFQIQKIGFGAGKRDYATTGVLRAMMLRTVKEDAHDTILSMETNIDDCSGEALSYTMQELLHHGALDVFYTPIYMKKNRPAVLLRVLCTQNKRSELESIIFRNTTTIGIRMQMLERTKLDRKIIAVETPWGMADVKCCTHTDETYYYPENDSVCRLAASAGIGFPEMYSRIQAYVRDTQA